MKNLWDEEFNDSTEENSHVKSEHFSINNKLIVSDTEIQTVENPVPEANTSVNETVEDMFMQDITSINSINFNERNYNTRVNKTPSFDISKTVMTLLCNIYKRYKLGRNDHHR